MSGTPGASNIEVSADADLDAGEERVISDMTAVTVMAAEAASPGFNVGTPEPNLIVTADLFFSNVEFLERPPANVFA